MTAPAGPLAGLLPPHGHPLPSPGHPLPSPVPSSTVPAPPVPAPPVQDLPVPHRAGDLRAATVLVGHPAPDIELPDQHGSPFSLAEARTAGPVLVVFFPFAFSGTCTGEMSALVEMHGQLTEADTTLVAVSCDQLFALRVFSDQLGMTFPVLSDFWPHGRLARAYGVFDADRGCAVRGSFLVDRAGVVRWSVVNPIGAGRDLPSHVAAAVALLPDLTT